MKLQSTRICKPCAPLRPRSNSHQTIPETRRRSSRLQSSQHTLGSYYESQSPLEQRPTETQTSQPVGAISNTCVPTSGPIEQPALVPSKAQVQEYLCPPQTRKPVHQPVPRPLKRPHASFLEDSVGQLPLSPASKRYRPESDVAKWAESAYRERQCRSDTLLRYLDGELIPRRLTKSVSNMEYAQDAYGFVMPPTPAYTPSVAPSNTSAGSSRKSLVEDPYYRENNLAENNIYIRSSREQYPEHIASLVDQIRMDRDSPGPSLDEVWQDMGLENLEMGTGETDVEDYFRGKIFPKPTPLDSLKRIDKNPMAKQLVPDVGSKLKISIPWPDMLFGYNRIEAFPQQQTQLRSMGNEMVANTQGLLYPFFVIEFKADGPGGSGSMWVATNQCLGGSASCVNIAERLNRQLRQCKSKEIQPIESAAFSIAMNGTEARLYVSWKHDELKLYMQKVDSFLLQKPKDYLEFRKHALNIIKWGKNGRLKEIRKSLDSLLEEGRRRVSEVAKSRPPPSDDSVSGSGQKSKALRKGKTSDDNQVSDAIQDFQSPYYREHEPPYGQQPLTSDCGYPIDDPQPVTSIYGYDSINTLEPVVSVYEHNATDGPHVLTSDDTYNPDMLCVQTIDHAPDDSTHSPITPYSSENLPHTPSSEIYEADPVEGSRKVDYAKSRRTRRKRYC